ncbi:hypothetical protein GCM10025858_19940 [Alicyclobacillus sacchari]|nr:hypothetical protein GCM10025858_19940 [Alicyclobacillus sacchari]
MKKLLNQADRYVDEMLDGIVAAHPELKRVPGTQVIVRAHPKAKVALVSGGGSGHEPAHAGYVGDGMLDAAVSGSVFTSPTPDQVLAAIRAVDQGQGVLLVIKNYTGDVMNFEMAADLASMEGIAIEKVIVADDVAVENSTYTVGKRGIAGTVFVHKIAVRRRKRDLNWRRSSGLQRRSFKTSTAWEWPYPRVPYGERQAKF